MKYCTEYTTLSAKDLINQSGTTTIQIYNDKNNHIVSYLIDGKYKPSECFPYWETRNHTESVNKFLHQLDNYFITNGYSVKNLDMLMERLGNHKEYSHERSDAYPLSYSDQEHLYFLYYLCNSFEDFITLIESYKSNKIFYEINYLSDYQIVDNIKEFYFESSDYNDGERDITDLIYDYILSGYFGVYFIGGTWFLFTDTDEKQEAINKILDKIKNDDEDDEDDDEDE